MQKANEEIASQLGEAQQHCQNLEATTQALFPEIQNEDAEASLQEVASTAERM